MEIALSAPENKAKQSAFSALSLLRCYGSRTAIAAIDITLVALACLLGEYILVHWGNGHFSRPLLNHFLSLAVCVYAVALFHFGIFQRSLRYAGVPDLLAVVKTVSISSTFLFLISRAVPSWRELPVLLFMLDGAISFFLLGVLHFSARIYNMEIAALRGQCKKVVIIGAGDGGASILKQLLLHANSGIRPVALIDDDPVKAGTSICGVPIAGNLAKLRKTVVENHASEILVCIPSASRSEMRRILAASRQCGVPIRTLPTICELVDGNVSLQDLQTIRIEDVLQRDRVTPDTSLMKTLIAGKTVLVTGAGGSIGSELCRQIAAAAPKQLIMIDKSENSLFYSHLAVREKFPELEAQPCLVDIVDREALKRVFERERPHLVFHAAAFKHVGMMELHPYEAIRNNVLGTRNVATLALETGAKQFVNISTDKAVNPRCYMGLSKKFAELLVQQLAKTQKTRFMNVRFGNVAGSSGSVLRLFHEQIKKGGPIRVTDPRATRFFMSIPEAVYLILCAAELGKGGETFILNMGEPINIYQLARTMTLLSGFVPDEELPIEFIGLREGEKVHEELWEDWEHPQATENPLLFAVKGSGPLTIDMAAVVEKFEAMLRIHDHDGLLDYVDRLVPRFAKERVPAFLVQDYPGSEVELTRVAP